VLQNIQFETKFPLTLQIRQQLAHKFAKHKVAQQRSDQCERHTKHTQEQIRHGQIQQIQIGDGSHPFVLHQRQNDQRIAQHGQQKDDRVERYLNLHGRMPFWIDFHLVADAGRRCGRQRRIVAHIEKIDKIGEIHFRWQHKTFIILINQITKAINYNPRVVHICHALHYKSGDLSNNICDPLWSTFVYFIT
jgi:hypothetical protein